MITPILGPDTSVLTSPTIGNGALGASPADLGQGGGSPFGELLPLLLMLMMQGDPRFSLNNAHGRGLTFPPTGGHGGQGGLQTRKAPGPPSF